MPTEAELLEANFEPIDLDKFFEPIDDSYEGQLKHLGITPERERQARGTALRAELAFEQGDQLEKEARRQAVADYNRQQDNALSRTEAVRGVARGTLQMGEGFSGAAETVAKLFDAGETPKALGDYFAARAKAIPSAVPSLRNVEDVGTFTEYGAKALGELFPQIVTSMIPAAGAAKLGKVVGYGKKGIAALTGAGAAASSIPQEVGHIFREIRDTTGKEKPLTAIAFGTPSGLLDAITPVLLVGKVLGATSAEAKKLAWREVVRNAVKEIPKLTAIEGLTEPVQEALAIAAVKTADSSYDAVNEENFWRLLDAAAMGAIGGGVFGGGTTVGATAINKVSRNQEALRLKNLRRGRDDARARLSDRRFDLEPLETSGGMPTPEVPLPPEVIALQQKKNEQQRSQERGVIIGRVEYNGITYEKAADGRWYSPGLEFSLPFGESKASAPKAERDAARLISELERRLDPTLFQTQGDNAAQTERTTSVIPAIPKTEEAGAATATVPGLGVQGVVETTKAPRGVAPGIQDERQLAFLKENQEDLDAVAKKFGLKLVEAKFAKVEDPKRSEVSANEYAARQLGIEQAGGKQQWLRTKALEAGQSVEDVYASERELEQNSKAVFRSGLTVGDILIVSGDEITELQNGQQTTVPLVKRFKVIREDGRLIAQPEDGPSKGLEVDSGQHFFNELKPPTMGGKILNRKLAIIRNEQQSTDTQALQTKRIATEVPPKGTELVSVSVAGAGTAKPSSQDTGTETGTSGLQANELEEARKLHQGAIALTPAAEAVAQEAKAISSKVGSVGTQAQPAPITPPSEFDHWNNAFSGPRNEKQKRQARNIVLDVFRERKITETERDQLLSKIDALPEPETTQRVKVVKSQEEIEAQNNKRIERGQSGYSSYVEDALKVMGIAPDQRRVLMAKYPTERSTVERPADEAITGWVPKPVYRYSPKDTQAIFSEAEQSLGSVGTTKGGEKTRQETKEAIPKQTPVAQQAAGVPMPQVENGGFISLLLPDGTAIVGERSHPSLFNAALELGIATKEQLIDSKSGFTRLDGSSWDLQGKFVSPRRIVRLDDPGNPISIPPVAQVATTLTTASARLRIPAINKGTRETTDLSAFAIPLPADVLLVDAKGNSPTQEQVRLKYRTSGKNPGLRLYVDNRPAYEITLPAGGFQANSTGISVNPSALMDIANWKRVGKTPERSPFTLERDSKKKTVAQQRAAEEAVDEKGDLVPLALVPGSPVAQNYEYDEARVADTHNAPPELKSPQALIDMIDADPSLVASVNSADSSAAIAAVTAKILDSAAQFGAAIDKVKAELLARQVIEELQENKEMLSVSPGARLVPTRVIASGKGATEITALLTNPAIDPAVAANGRQLLAALPSQYMDGLTLNIVARQEQGGSRVTQSGSFSAATSIATILQNATDENTVLHEVSHWLSTFLNPVERARNNQLWRQELDRELATATGDRLAVLQAIKDANGLTSQEYLAQSQSDTSTYHLSNPDEFFAYRFTNQARAELKRDNAIDYVRNLLKRILEAVKRLVGRGDFYDAVWRKFMAGEFSVDARSGPLFERNKYGVAASLEPIASRDAYQSFMRGSQTATPDINRFKQTVSWFQNESVVGRITNSFAALPRGVKSELDFLRGRIVAMGDALAALGTAPNVTGNVVARAQALSPDPVEQNQLVFSVVNGTMEVEHAALNLEQRAIELDKELRLAQSKDTKDSAFADLANDILSKAVPAQRTLLRQSNLTVFLEGGTIGAAETAQAVAATSSYANLVAKVADANNGISRKQRILEYQLNNVNQARQYLASQVLSDPRTQQDYRDGIAARGVRAVVLSEVGGTVTYEDPLAPTDRSKDVTVSFSLDATEVLANQQKLLDLAAKMDQYLQIGTDELRKAAYVDELDRIWNYHLSTRNFPSTGKLLFGKGDVFRWLTFGGRVAIPDYITKFIGGEPARKLSIALKNYSEARQQAMNHQDRLRQNIYTAIYRAAKAHKMKRDEWMRKVGKPILDSHAAFGAVRPIKTGMKLAGNIVVLRSDMEAIEAQATFFRIVAGAVGEMSNKLSSAQPSPVLIYEQATAKRPAYERKPLQASRFMLPRMIGRQWRNLAARWLVAQKAGNTAALVDMVNDPAHWQGFLSHLRAYEDPSYVIKSDFVQAYRMVQEDIYNGNVPADFDGLVTMVDLELGGTVPRADIEEKMLGELTEVMRLLNNPVTPSQVDVSIISGENFMNNPRGQSIAPPGMYEIGLDTEGSQFSLISQVAEVYGQRYLNALQGVKEALEKKAVEYKGKEKSGITRKQVEKESREAQLAGDTFVNYQELLTLQKQVFHQLQQFLELAQSKQGFDVEMSRGLRLLGNITGALLQTPGVLFRNSLGGPIRAVAIDAAIGYSTSIFGIRLPIISTALNTSKNALLFARGARQLALGMISNRLARTAVGRAARRTLQNNPTFWNSTAQWLASVMNKHAQAYQTADDLGLLKEAPIKEQIGNYFRLFSEGGRIVGDDPKAMQKLIRSAESIVGILFELGIPIANFPRKVLPALIDDALNVVSDTFAAHVTESVSKNALKSLTARASLNARTDELTPQEILGRSGATAKQLEWLRLLFDQNNISLDRALIEYYQNVEAAKAAGQNPNAVQFLTPQQYDSLRLTFANELNRAGFMNRPALFAKSAFARAFGTFFGYPAQTNTQFSVFMSKHSRDTRTLAGREGFLLVMQLMLMIVLFGTLLAAPGADLLHRIFYNRERQIPQLSSAKDGWDLARIAFMQSGALMPTVGGVFNYMIEQTKPGMGMGGSGVNLLPISLFNGTMDALRAAYQTGDVIRPAVSFVRRWIPNSQIVLNRTPFMEGSIEGGNVRAILDRNAPTSIERRGFGFGGNIKRSSTSDDIDGIVNAIYRGDSSTAKRLTDKAVEERRASGIAKPENSVYSSVLSRNPYNSLFGKTLTEGERALVFSRLKPQDRARVTKAEDAFQSYAQSSGRNEPTFVSSRGTTPRRSSRSRTRSYRSRSRRFSIRSRNRFRIRGLGRRRNRRLFRV